MTETPAHPTAPLIPPRGFAAGLAILLVLLPLAHVRGGQSTMVGVLVLCLLGWSARAGTALFRDLPGSLCVAMLTWAGFATATALWSPDPLSSLEYAGQTVWLPIAMGVLAFRLGADPAARRTALYAACIGLGVLATVILVGLFRGEWNYLSFGVDPAVEQHWLLRWYSGPGLSSSFLLLGLPLVYWGLREKLLPRWLWILPMLMVLAGAATFNRIYWPVLAIGGVVLAMCEPALLRLRRSLWFWIVLVAGVCAVLGALVVAMQYRVGSDLSGGMWQSAVRSLTSDSRFLIWRAWSDAIWQTNPWFGLGYGKKVVSSAYAGLLTPYIERGLTSQALTHPHNIFMSLWAQTGFVGLFLFLVLMVTAARSALRLRHHPAARHVWGAALALIAILLGKMLTDDFYDRVPAILFWIYLGLLLGAGSSFSRRDHHV